MRQAADSPALIGDLDSSIAYVLKQAASALRGAMEEALRPLELSVAQYSVLEQLRQSGGLTNAQLARGAFVTRQAMNGVLRGLEERGAVRRPAETARGRELPAELTATGGELIAQASARVAGVQNRMLAPLDQGDRTRLLGALKAAIEALDGPG
jgi:DNA-binding MarR family transcriptional regulator